jgi:hypothetical protein
MEPGTKGGPSGGAFFRRPQSGRASAGVRTTNRPNAGLAGSLARTKAKNNEKQKTAKQQGLVPVTEK